MKTATVPRATQRRNRTTPKVGAKRVPSAATVPQASIRALQKYRNYRKYVKDELL